MTAKDLKNALLQEAVQGRLVPQIAAEGNAKDLLAEIKKAREGGGSLPLAAAAKASSATPSAGTPRNAPDTVLEPVVRRHKRSAVTAVTKSDLRSKSQIRVTKKELPPVTAEEIPFDIPENWCWVYFGDVFQHNTGKTQNSSVETKNGTIRKFITTSNLYWNEFDFTKVKEMLFSDSELARCTATKGDLLICEGGEYGRSAIWNYDYDVCFQNHIHRARPYLKNSLDIRFYYYVIYLFRNIGLIEGRGVGIKSLSTENLHQLLIPLPPLAEQKRIVAAIEKFMPLVEEYGKKESALNLLNAKIGTLTKKAILQEAVQGRLVPQIATEGSAKDLLDKIKKARTKSDLRSKSQIRVTRKELPPVTAEEIPFDIPENWCWCRLGEVVPFGQCENADPNEIQDDAWILDLEDIEKDSGVILQFKTKKDADSKSTKHIFKKGYVLYSKLRPYLNKCVIAPKDGYCTSEILPLNFGNFVNNKFAQLFLMSPYFVDYTNSLSFGVKMPRLGTEDGKKALFPLPPLAEQKRIVAAIEQLLPLCQKLGQ